jgi:hypothetical protein
LRRWCIESDLGSAVLKARQVLYPVLRKRLNQTFLSNEFPLLALAKFHVVDQFVRNGGKAHIDQLLLTNLNYEWQGNSERRARAFYLFTDLPVTPWAARSERNNRLRFSPF